jgi:triosephosphate isomerase (TIM)
MRKKIVAGNWKMNGDRDGAMSLANEIKGMLADEARIIPEIIVAPPFVHLAAVGHLLSGSGVGIAAQNCSSEPSGAFTGEVSAGMIHSVGAEFVIIGHSERRTYFNEQGDLLFKKLKMALASSLVPIYCIGETLPQRESNSHFKTIEKQLEETIFLLSSEEASSLILAYEPVWAIGTGKTATPRQAQEMHQYIRKLIRERFDASVSDSIPVLYGGSCNESNAKELFALPDVDGGLIGGASLKSRSFVNIIKSF